MSTTLKMRKFANYDDAKAFRANRIRFGYVTSLCADWQGIYWVGYRLRQQR